MRFSRMKLWWIMVAVAFVAILLGCTVQSWRWHQREKFAREYALGWLENESEVLVRPDARPEADK